MQDIRHPCVGEVNKRNDRMTSMATGDGWIHPTLEHLTYHTYLYLPLIIQINVAGDPGWKSNLSLPKFVHTS